MLGLFIEEKPKIIDIDVDRYHFNICHVIKMFHIFTFQLSHFMVLWSS